VGHWERLKRTAPREMKWRDNPERAEHPLEGNYKNKGETCSLEVPSCFFQGCE
jgi:hypothetical protein